jgi:decaprenyl-phosphate phosphoribosyltransferase
MSAGEVSRGTPDGPPRPRAGAAPVAGHLPSALLRLARPAQWPKNLLVLAAPAAAGVVVHPVALGRAAAAAVAFVLASVAVYAANDVRDAEDDRRHPVKRYRPVASGQVAPPVAVALSVAAALGGLTVAAALGLPTLALVAAYLAMSAAYVVRLKHVPVVDLVVVASGFVLRSLGGATAARLTVSNWFLLVSLFGALFIVCAKRRAELRDLGAAARTRPALAAYSTDWLSQVLGMSLTGTVLSYALWAFQPADLHTVRAVLAVSVLPVLVGLLRYLLLVDTVGAGDAERPEVALLSDRVVLVSGAVWVALIAWGLYLN